MTNQDQIFGPMFAMLFLTVIVWVYMFAKRIPFINSLKIQPNDLTPDMLATRSPPSVSNPSDNLKNLFEIPLLFYVSAFYLFLTHNVDVYFLVAAWLFVFFRTLHSAIHCTINRVMLRFALYAISCICLFFIIIRSAIFHFFGG